MQLWCLLLIKYKLVPAVAKASKAHKRFWDFLVSVKNAQCPVFARLLTWFRSGPLSSFQYTVGLIVRFFRRGTPAFPLSMAQKRSCCEPAAGLSVPAGHRGGTSSPTSFARQGAGGPQGFPGSPRGTASLAFASLQPHLLEATKLFYEKNALIPSSKNHCPGSHPLCLPFRSPLHLRSEPDSPLAPTIPSLVFIHLV